MADWDDIIGSVGGIKTLGCEQIVLTHVLVAKGSEGADGVSGAAARPRLAEQSKQLESQGFALTA